MTTRLRKVDTPSQPIFLASPCPCVLLFKCLGILVSGCPIVPVSCCLSVLVSWCHSVQVSWCSEVLVSQCLNNLGWTIVSKTGWDEQIAQTGAEMECSANTASMLAEEIWQIAEEFVKVPPNLKAQLKTCGRNIVKLSSSSVPVQSNLN